MVGLVGFGAGNFGGSSRSIGTVGDTEIDTNRYFRELNATLRSFQATTGQSLPMAQAEAFGLTSVALERVITAASMDNETTRLGISVGDAELRERLMQVPQFQGVDGKFSADAYEFALDNTGQNSAEFEAGMRSDLSRALLQTALTDGVVVTPVFTETLFAFARETRDFTWGKLDLAALETQPEAPSDEALTTYYEAHPADYTLPQIKHVSIAWLKPESLLDSVEVDAARLQKLYAAHPEYNVPERRLVERLVFGTDADAQAAWDSLEAGETDFAALVEARGLNLADTDLGDVSLVDLEDAGAAVFALTEPGLVGPLPSNLGPAIFRMNAILSAQITPFADVETELRAEESGDAARRMIVDQISELDDMLAGGATVEELADATDGMQLLAQNWSVESTGGIAGYEEFQTAVLAAQEGDFPELITLSDGGVFALRVDSSEAPRLQELDEVRAEVTDGWTHEESLVLLAEQARGMLPKLQDGGESLASLGLTEVSEAGQDRGAVIDGTPPELLTEVFTIEVDTWAVLDDSDGVVLMRLDRVNTADQTTEEAVAAKTAFGEQMSQEIGLDLASAFSAALQEQAGITLNQQVINAVHRQFP